MIDSGTLTRIYSSFGGQVPSTGKQVEEAFNNNCQTIEEEFAQLITNLNQAVADFGALVNAVQSAKVDKTAVKQVAGSSTTDLMSQKAVSDMFEHLATNLNQAVADFGALVNAVQSAKVDKTAVKQVTGSSTIDLMSQKAVSDIFEHLATNLNQAVADFGAQINAVQSAKVDKTAVKQVTGSSTIDLISQDAVTKLVASTLSNSKNYTDTKTGGLIRGVTINGQYLSGAKRVIEEGETLLVPEGFEYVASSLTVKGNINSMGTITII